MTQFQENTQADGRAEGRTEGQTEGWKDGQTLYQMTLLATARGPIRKDALNQVFPICKPGKFPSIFSSVT